MTARDQGILKLKLIKEHAVGLSQGDAIKLYYSSSTFAAVIDNIIARVTENIMFLGSHGYEITERRKNDTNERTVQKS